MKKQKDINKESSSLFHQHLLVKCWVSNPPMKEKDLNKWLKKLVEAIDMKICIPPRSKYVNTIGNRGITGLAGIETSHLALHCWDEESPSLIQMDCYSCKKFNPDIIIEKLKEFGLIKYELMYIDRNKKFKVKSQLTAKVRC